MRSFSGPFVRTIPHLFVRCGSFEDECNFVMDDPRGFISYLFSFFYICLFRVLLLTWCVCHFDARALPGPVVGRETLTHYRARSSLTTSSL